MYSEERVAPCREEALLMGCKELKSDIEVANAVAKAETAVVLINSVCGCAAKLARPALKLAMETSEHAPSELFSVFAGVDGDATDQVRALCPGTRPSSPSYALFKNGEFQELIGRQAIEGYPIESVYDTIETSFERSFGSN